MIRRRVVGRIVHPFAFEKAVVRRRQFESVHSKLAQVGPAGLQNWQSAEIRTARVSSTSVRTSRNVPTARSS